MGSPLCVANKSVPESKVQAAQTKANEKFKVAKPVSDKELLKKTEQIKRAEEICKKTGFCGEDWWKGESGEWARKFDLNDYARKVTDYLNPPTGLDDRTFSNLARLFSSKRVGTSEIVNLIKLYREDKKTDFRQAAQDLFLNAQLFYYDYVPFKGAIMCYMEEK